MVEREAERAVLGLVPAGSETEDQPSSADLVDGRRLLRQHRRGMEARRCDERTELDPRRGRRQGSQHRPALPGPARLRFAWQPIQEVIADPDRVEPERLGAPGKRDVLGPADLALDLGELDSDLEWAAHLESLADPDRPARTTIRPRRPGDADLPSPGASGAAHLEVIVMRILVVGAGGVGSAFAPIAARRVVLRGDRHGRLRRRPGRGRGRPGSRTRGSVAARVDASKADAVAALVRDRASPTSSTRSTRGS